MPSPEGIQVHAALATRTQQTFQALEATDAVMDQQTLGLRLPQPPMSGKIDVRWWKSRWGGERTQASEAGIANFVALSDGTFIAMLASLKVHEVRLVRYLRPMARKDKGSTNVQHYEVRDLHIHDLRRTLGSWLASSGTSLPIIGRVLNHKTPEATKVYARLIVAPVRNAMEEATAAMRRTGAV